jgi:choline-sulfatase
VSFERPNIMIIMADQMAAPALPMYGHPLVDAPHLERLASEGVACLPGDRTIGFADWRV